MNYGYTDTTTDMTPSVPVEMYDDLIKELREQSRYLICTSRFVSEKRQGLFKKSADTIEELSAKYEKALRDLVKCGSAPRWIPVTERLPEEWKSVLTYQPYVGDEEKPLIRVSWYIGAGSWRECEQANKLELPVTHWMPLPVPPKEET